VNKTLRRNVNAFLTRLTHFYSPDLSQCDFWTFVMLKHKMTGLQVQAIENRDRDLGRYVIRRLPY
jgi:hypothetical protein